MLLCKMEEGRLSKPIPSFVLGFVTLNKFCSVTLQYQSPPSRAAWCSFAWSIIVLSPFKIRSSICMHSTSHITKLPLPASVPSAFISSTLHSSFTGLSFTIGGCTCVAFSLVKPAFINSSTSFGNSQLVNEVCCTISYDTILITTSGTSFTFSKVCLVVLFLTLRDGEKITTGGLIENKLKKLNGDKFTLPLASILLTNAMGLGAMAYCKKFCAC